jgi:hypothetical protein
MWVGMVLVGLGALFVSADLWTFARTRKADWPSLALGLLLLFVGLDTGFALPSVIRDVLAAVVTLLATVVTILSVRKLRHR